MSLSTFRDTDAFKWTDLSNPRRESFKPISAQFPLSPSDIEDCMNPRHLPKREVRPDAFQFLLLRVFDPKAKPDAATTHQLTRKFAIYYSETKLLTVHRADFEALNAIQTNAEITTPRAAVQALLTWAIQSYAPILEQAQAQFEELEGGVFRVPGAKRYRIQTAYQLRRRMFVVKRMLRLTRDLLLNSGFEHEVRDSADQLLFYAEELHESVTQLMQIQLSLVSQDTNESSLKLNDSMKILTVFSAFFLPLNFIAGVYGMNFEIMPELKWKYGYPLALGAMALVSILTWIGFKRSRIITTHPLKKGRQT